MPRINRPNLGTWELNVGNPETLAEHTHCRDGLPKSWPGQVPRYNLLTAPRISPEKFGPIQCQGCGILTGRKIRRIIDLFFIVLPSRRIPGGEWVAGSRDQATDLLFWLTGSEWVEDDQPLHGWMATDRLVRKERELRDLGLYT